MVPFYFHNTTLKCHCSPLCQRSAQDQQNQESTGAQLGLGWKTISTGSLDSLFWAFSSLISFNLFPTPLAQSAIIYHYSGEDILKTSMHREKSLEWNTQWELVRERASHEWKWPSPEDLHPEGPLPSPTWRI